MSESSLPEPKSRAHQYWEWVVNGWPVIAGVLAVTWTIILTLGEGWVKDIVDQEYKTLAASEPQIQEIKGTLTAIRGDLDNLEGNDNEIRGQLGTVINRLDQVIAIQLQAANRPQ